MNVLKQVNNNSIAGGGNHILSIVGGVAMSAMSAIAPISASAQDIRITPDMYEYSQNSVPGHNIYSCTPSHVEKGECFDVDQSYFDTLAVLSGNAGLYEIALMRYNDGETAIGYNGNIGFGSAEALRIALDRYPDVKTLIINSDGGVETEADLMAQLVEERGMNTWVIGPWTCLSACSQVLLAGNNVRIDGVVGIHTGDFHIRDPYEIRDVQAAEETFSNGIDGFEGIIISKLRLFEKLGVENPTDLLEVIFNADGNFVVFENMDEIIGFTRNTNYRVMDIDEINSLVEGRSTPGFSYEGRETILSTLG